MKTALLKTSARVRSARIRSARIRPDLWLVLSGVVFPGLLLLPLAVLVSWAAPSWTDPAVVWAETWPDTLRFAINGDATTLVALIPNSGQSEKTRELRVSEKTGGQWSEPTLLAANGVYSDATFQVLPEVSRPVISRDGSTIAYLGAQGDNYLIFISDRGPQGWSEPAALATGLSNHHYMISLSADGNTLALADYPFLGSQHVYVVTRQNGAWGLPVRISVESGQNWGGGNPSLSDDGQKIVFVSNARILYAEMVNGVWSAPLAISTNDPYNTSAELPQLSADGQAIYYWLVNLVPQGSAQVRVSQDLYLVRCEDQVWGQPQKVSTGVILPSHATDAPAAANATATRISYSRPVTTTDPTNGDVYIHASHLEISEWNGEGWSETRLVEQNGFGNYNRFPQMALDGLAVLFDGGIRYADPLPVYQALWQVTTTDAPPLPPQQTSTTAIIGPEGGTLTSTVDMTIYFVPPGTFNTGVTMTHSIPPGPPPPPPGWFGLGHAFGLSAVDTETGLAVQPLRPITVTIGLPTADTAVSPAALPADTEVALWRWDTGAWILQGDRASSSQAVYSDQIDRLGLYALFGEARRLYLPLIHR